MTGVSPVYDLCIRVSAANKVQLSFSAEGCDNVSDLTLYAQLSEFVLTPTGFYLN
jgi:hypothetical protein